MEIWQKSKYIARIVSGRMRFRISDNYYYVCSPTRLQRCLAEQMFAEQMEEAEFAGAWSQEYIESFLHKKGIWTEEDKKNMAILENDIEKLKIGLYETRLRPSKLEIIRLALDKARIEFDRLFTLQHSYDQHTPVGIASAAKQRYLLGCSIYLEDNTPYWNGESGWFSPDPIIDKIMLKLNSCRIDDHEFREIARSEPWNTLWAIQKHCREPLFEGSSIDLTDDQKNLIIWSTVYEQIREHPDNLQDEIIDDDDMLDGWMLIKKKERKKNHTKNAADNIQNEKIRNAAEQFRPVESYEEARMVMGLNEDEAQINFKQRMQTIKEKGMVTEQEMPDTKFKLHQERMEKFSQHINSMKGK